VSDGINHQTITVWVRCESTRIDDACKFVTGYAATLPPSLRVQYFKLNNCVEIDQIQTASHRWEHVRPGKQSENQKMTLSFVPFMGLAMLWSVRSLYDLNAVVKDEGLILACLIWRNLGVLFDVLGRVSNANIAIVVGFSTALLFLALHRSWTHPTNGQRGQGRQKIEKPSNSTLKPLLLPCRTSHTRFFPKKHSFSYSYLFVGIPIGWQGAVKSVISADHKLLRSDEPDSRRGWFSVEAEDYLDRGSHPGGLRGKLHAYLQSQKIKPEKYPYAYLVTAPRFLGYSFNPVSFWYLYSKQHELKAMILEVNNTFDERRMYFMDGDSSHNATYENGTHHDESEDKTAKFTYSWPKDFHISPFNSRKGSYSLAAIDPFSTHRTGNANVSNAVTLFSSKGHPKLVARVYSTNTAIDPESLTRLQFFRFVLNWWWVGLVTFPRILREAFKLFFQMKLHVWYRPEVAKTSIGRTETKEEAILERSFRAYLKRQVQVADACMKVRYISAGRSCVRNEVFKSEKSCASAHELTFKVLTPAFYSRFVSYAHSLEAVDREYLCASEKERTFWISLPELLPVIFNEQDSASHPPSEQGLGVGDRVRWSVLRRLRMSTSRPHSPTPYTVTDIRNFALSPLDRFIMSTQPADNVREYRRTVLSLLLSNLIALGEPALLQMIDWIVRGALAYATLSALITASGFAEGNLDSSVMEAVLTIGKLSSLSLCAGLKSLA
jgi:DUF1365 family protein